MLVNKSGLTRVFASRRTKNVQIVVPNEREHVTILTIISTIGESIFNYYIFKDKRAKYKYITLCKDGTTIGMSKKGCRVAIWRAWEREPVSLGACEQEKI